MRANFERRSGPRVYSQVTVGGIDTACVSRHQLGGLMVGDCLAARGGRRSPRLVFASNGHAIAMAALDRRFRDTFAKADLIHADGEPVVAASKLLSRTPVPERSATTDFLFDAAEAAAKSDLTFFLLGSTEEINARAAAKVGAAGVRVVGRRNGYFSRAEEEAVIAAINASGADVLWVGLGVPFEYEFCLRNKSRLKVGWVVTCGGCFNFAAGDYQRAPVWMQENGLEWLFRLWREPRRLFWRYLVTNPVAIAMLLFRTGAKPAS
jgi:N-acetylglucosaminyldiphosphoundecaprenol N-acetyl-beta-D-mannosaminyltransferase